MRRARIKMGGADELKEECRQSWGIGLIDSVVRDIAYAVRVLVKSPGFTASVALGCTKVTTRPLSVFAGNV